MEVYNKYAALADTIKIEDITSNKHNQTILYKLRNNDSDFTTLYIMSEETGDDDDYVLDDGENTGWLGYFIGNNTNLHKLGFYTTINDESFYQEMSCNTSIQLVEFGDHSLLNERMFMILLPFFKNNYNLIGFEIESCMITTEGIRQLSISLGSSRSLKHIKIANLNDDINYVPLADIITAMSMHPQLEDLDLSGTSIGRNECTALSTLLQCTTTQLQTLDLANNNIDDDGLESLVNGLVHLNQLQQLTLTGNQLITSSGWKIFSTLLEIPGSNLDELYLGSCSLDDEGIQALIDGIVNVNKLQELHIGSNPAITIQGWRAVATLFEMPQSSLKKLYILYNNIGDEEVLLFAKALVSNSALETLGCTCGSRITAEGWAPFSKLLCDTSTVHKTYTSNHTLQCFGLALNDSAVPKEVISKLEVNGTREDKQQVAMRKILQYHTHFNMEPFFEWEFKVLPIMIHWFTKANACTTEYEYRGKINKMKLSVIYDFIKEFPMLYIEPVTRKEIAEYTTMEEEMLQGDQIDAEHEVQLEEIRQSRARAIKRLG